MTPCSVYTKRMGSHRAAVLDVYAPHNHIRHPGKTGLSAEISTPIKRQKLPPKRPCIRSVRIIMGNTKSNGRGSLVYQ